MSQKKKTKEADRQPNLQDGPLNVCRSLGSNCHPSSQSRKISIGAIVDSPISGRSTCKKELKLTTPNPKVAFSSLENSKQRNWKEKDTGNVNSIRKPKGSEAPQQMNLPKKISEPSNRSTETLRLKLREILENVSSPTDQPSKCQKREQDTNQVLTEQKLVQKNDGEVRFRQNSDSIEVETDSESPDQIKNGPMIRSTKRKRPLNPMKSFKTKSSLRNKLKQPAGNTFEFQPQNIYFPEKDNETGIFPRPAEIETQAPGGEPSPVREVLGLRSSPAKRDKIIFGTGEKDKKTEFNQSPQTNKIPLGGFNSPTDFEQQDVTGNSCLKKNVVPQSHIESPTFRMETPVCSSPSSTSKSDKMVNDHSSPELAEEEFVMRGSCSSWEFQTSEGYCNGPNIKPHSSDDDKEIEQSPPSILPTILKERAPDFGLSNELNCIRPGERNWTEEILVQNQDDELARAVKLCCSEFLKLKSKITSASAEKCSEILSSVAESFQLQLQNFETQIQMDMVKLLSLAKSRQKILEKKFQEKEEQLNYIHKKFKEEVNQHLQDYSSLQHELDAQKIEFKGIVEKRRALNRSTLVQVEEAVSMQLSEAEKRIKSVNEARRRKMLQMKHMIDMCLK